MSAPSPNTSFFGEPIQLAKGFFYFVIDALYLNDVVLKSHKVDKENLEHSIRTDVFSFPNTDIPLAKFFTIETTFHPNQLVRIKSNEVTKFKKTLLLDSDTGLLLFIHQDVFLDLILNSGYDYDNLFSSRTGEFDLSYWSSLTAKYDASYLAIIEPVMKLENSTYMGGGGTFLIAEQPLTT